MKKTRRRDGDALGPSSPWDEIAPGLWMGGHYWADPAGELWPAVVEDEYDLVISLFTRTGHGPGPRAEHIVMDIPDAELTAGHSTPSRASPAPRDWPSTRASPHWSAATRATTGPASSSPSASSTGA
ncbi:hypothetical protein [Streptomyces avidinii]|uniref:hypothetical protein n=1 Tax=Streptomyces avidinii TaxID=1895 RepID=UPI003865C1C8